MPLSDRGDPKSQAIFGEDNYLLLTLRRGQKTMTMDLKGLDGKLLDRTALRARE